MGDTRYDIYLTGKLADGVSTEQARARLAALFKTTVDAVSSLVDGQPHRLKKDVDEVTAKRYLAALQKAGLAAAVKRLDAAEPTPSGSTTEAGLSLAPPGTPVLADSERTVVDAVAVDTGALSLASVFDVPPASTSTPPLEAPDFGLAPPGSLIETLPQDKKPLNPDTSRLSLAQPGADLLEGVDRPAPPPTPDTNHISLER